MKPRETLQLYFDRLTGRPGRRLAIVPDEDTGVDVKEVMFQDVVIEDCPLESIESTDMRPVFYLGHSAQIPGKKTNLEKANEIMKALCSIYGDSYEIVMVPGYPYDFNPENNTVKTSLASDGNYNRPFCMLAMRK